MQHLIMTAAMASASLAGKEQNIEFNQNLEKNQEVSNKYFIRQHKEAGYTYKTWGVGVEYKLEPQEGFGFKTSLLTDLKKDRTLIESEHALHYKFRVGEYTHLMPILSTRVSSHQIYHEEVLEEAINYFKNIFIHKYTGFAGVGISIDPDATFSTRIDALLFRDLHNALLIQENDRFWGKKYSNPYGFKLQGTFISNLHPSFGVQIGGHYTNTFSSVYEEIGGEISFKWRF